MEYFIFNGKLHNGESVAISPNNRGIRYGDGLFETMKSEKRQVQFLDDHFARLWQGMQVLQFNIPKHFTPDKLEYDIFNLLEKNGHSKSTRVRLTVFRGDGGLYDVANHKVNYIIQTWALPEENGAFNTNGLVLGIYSDVKKQFDILSNLKHNNFLLYALAALHAKKNKWNDAVLLNTQLGICDTTIANIFVVKGEEIVTPALEEACIAGVMRKNVINELAALNQRVIERKLHVEEMLNADEVFLTNSIHNIRWVQRIGEKSYSNKQTKQIYSKLFQTISS